MRNTEMDAGDAIDQMNETTCALDFLAAVIDGMELKPEHGPGIKHLLALCADRLDTCDNVLRSFWARNLDNDQRTAAGRGQR